MSQIEIIDGNEGTNQEMDLTGMDLPERFLALTHNNQVSAKVWEAMEVLTSADVPPHMIEKRPGPTGQQIMYIKHVVITTVLNLAFKWLWNYEVSNIHVGKDGSVAVLGKLTLHIPVKRNADGTDVYHQRIIQEVGAFDAYPMTVQEPDGEPDATGVVKMKTVFKRDENGNVQYTMCEADRIASAASRGLVKCTARAFGFGLSLMEKEATPMTFGTALRLLLAYGQQKWGLEEQAVRELLRSKGLSKANLVDNYEMAFQLIREAGETKQGGL